MMVTLPTTEQDTDALAAAAARSTAHAPSAQRPAAAWGAGGAAPDIDGAVLVVEDAPALAAVMAEALQGEGHRVAVAWNGADALHLARRGRPSCILLDLHLPVLDGPAFLAAYRAPEAEPERHIGAAYQAPKPEPRAVRPLDAGQPAPVILVTALSGAEAAGEAERLGTAGFLTKPYNLDALAALVERFASRSPA